MTGVLVTTVKAESVQVGDLIKKKIGEKEIILGVLEIKKSNLGERDLKLTVTDVKFMKAPHNYYAFFSDQWEKIGTIDVDEYWRDLNKKTPIAIVEPDKAKYDYLQEYNKRVPPLKQLTLSENDARIKSFETRDWWGNKLTSDDASEHLWNLYQKEESLNYKHFYLKLFAKSKGFKLPPYDRDTYGFPIFTEEQIKQLEALHDG